MSHLLRLLLALLLPLRREPERVVLARKKVSERGSHFTIGNGY